MTHDLPGFAGAIQRKVRTKIVAKRFSRFVLAAVAAVAASQITLTVCLGPLHMTAGISAFAAWVAGAGTSYVVSRWAWERKGRPQVLKETLPFWIVSVGAMIVLTSTAKLANQQAYRMGLTHPQRVLFVDAAVLIANGVTFVTRFLIFHYVLFKDRGGKKQQTAVAASEAAGQPAAAQEAGVSGAERPSAGEAERGPFAASGSGMLSSGWTIGAAERSPGRRAADPGAFPEPGSRR